MMPEGPEVKCLVDQLNYDYNSINKYKLISTSIISGRYMKKLPIGYTELISNFPLNLISIKSKGKFIYFTLQNNVNNNTTIWQTLGLTGGFSLNPNVKHIRYTLTFISNDNIKKTLYFYDQRNFGTLKISFNDNELIKKLDSIGPGWINNQISYNDFLYIVENTIKKSKNDVYLVKFLMNQKKTSGIGNYIISEVLYDTKIWPYVKMNKISKDSNDWFMIYNSIKNIINSSYKTQRNNNIYNNNNMNESNIFSFKVYSQIYCPNGYKVIREEGPHNRTIHYVPELQLKYKENM
jgi:formamidopyrimidine-DNA glycosylase